MINSSGAVVWDIEAAIPQGTAPAAGAATAILITEQETYDLYLMGFLVGLIGIVPLIQLLMKPLFEVNIDHTFHER